MRQMSSDTYKVLQHGASNAFSIVRIEMFSHHRPCYTTMGSGFMDASEVCLSNLSSLRKRRMRVRNVRMLTISLLGTALKHNKHMWHKGERKCVGPHISEKRQLLNVTLSAIRIDMVRHHCLLGSHGFKAKREIYKFKQDTRLQIWMKLMVYLLLMLVTSLKNTNNNSSDSYNRAYDYFGLKYSVYSIPFQVVFRLTWGGRAKTRTKSINKAQEMHSAH